MTAAVCWPVLIALAAHGGVTLTNLFSFDNLKSGYDPRPRLVQYTIGVLYGTTSGGGTKGQGTVFKMTPDGTVTTLVTFNGTNGSEPYGG
ncbi:MAG TPA: choice-of-anchor tandem repeat GloVer-containing protein, partial [Desulfobaccales bacterium]